MELMEAIKIAEEQAKRDRECERTLGPDCLKRAHGQRAEAWERLVAAGKKLMVAQFRDLCAADLAEVAASEPERLPPAGGHMLPPIGDDWPRVSTGELPASVPAAPESAGDARPCECARCQQEDAMRHRYLSSRRPMPVCGCGNKRCPKALWHGYRCTGSNEPNQKCEPEQKSLADIAPEPACFTAIMDQEEAT